MHKCSLNWGSRRLEVYCEAEGRRSWRSDLMNWLTGRLALIGPDYDLHHHPAGEGDLWPGRRPGIFSLGSLRRQTGIAFHSLPEIENEYLRQRSLASDLRLLIKCLLLSWLPRNPGEPPEQVRLFGLQLANPTLAQAVETLTAWTQQPQLRTLAFLNAHCVNVLHQDAEYRQALSHFDWLLADGFGVRLAALQLGQPLRDNLNGTDLFPALCRSLEDRGGRVFLLGGKAGVAEGVANWVGEQFPRLERVGTRHGYFSEDEEEAIVERIRQSQANLLLVALGVPAQELWIERNRHRLPPLLVLGVGGLFDFYSGKVSRAPQWLRELGLEWLYRLLQEPRRLARRYLLGNFVFFYHLWREKRKQRS